MRVAAPVELSPEQITALERMARQRSLPVRLVERARIVLLAAEGLENNQIARRMHITPEKVARWRSRFLAGGHGSQVVGAGCRSGASMHSCARID